MDIQLRTTNPIGEQCKSFFINIFCHEKCQRSKKKNTNFTSKSKRSSTSFTICRTCDWWIANSTTCTILKIIFLSTKKTHSHQGSSTDRYFDAYLKIDLIQVVKKDVIHLFVRFVEEKKTNFKSLSGGQNLVIFPKKQKQKNGNFRFFFLNPRFFSQKMADYRKESYRPPH